MTKEQQEIIQIPPSKWHEGNGSYTTIFKKRVVSIYKLATPYAGANIILEVGATLYYGNECNELWGKLNTLKTAK